MKAATGTVFRDVITLALAGFAAIAIILLSHVNPPEKKKEDSKQPGNVAVEIRWKDGINTDVDLWVQAPGDIPVGYSNLSGEFFNLLRDDLGKKNDVLDLNYEIAYSRGIPPGEYIVNLHLYRLGKEPLPLDVAVVVSTRWLDETTIILATDASITSWGQEMTVLRFELTEKGVLVDGSVHSIFKKLRHRG